MRVPPFVGAQRKMTRRLSAVVLGSQAPVVLFAATGARALADASGHAAATTYLWVGIGLTIACVLAAGLLRTPIGVTLGWLLQVATVLCGFVVPVMVVVGLIFCALWWVALTEGVRLDDMTEAYLRDHPDLA